MDTFNTQGPPSPKVEAFICPECRSEKHDTITLWDWDNLEEMGGYLCECGYTFTEAECTYRYAAD